MHRLGIASTPPHDARLVWIYSGRRSLVHDRLQPLHSRRWHKTHQRLLKVGTRQPAMEQSGLVVTDCLPPSLQ